jgi:hypothetical protein
MVLNLYVCAALDMQARMANPKPRANDLSFMFFSSVFIFIMRGLDLAHGPFIFPLTYKGDIPGPIPSQPQKFYENLKRWNTGLKYL